MTTLAIYPEHQPEQITRSEDASFIAEQLQGLGVVFERWDAAFLFDASADQDTILKAYAPQVNQLKSHYGFQSADVIHVQADHPQKTELRAKFLNEHVHSDFEVRFFVEGRGLFYLHPNDKVYALLCEQGDLISVPAGMKHWFDLGAEPHLKCIRLFTTPEGWVANFTGDPIAEHFQPLETFAPASRAAHV